MSAVLPVYSRCNLMFERGEGVYLFTAGGTRYLDFASGIAVNSLGHSHPHLVSETVDQVKKLWHVSNLYQIDGLEKLAKRIVDQCFADYIFFCNSGAEAVECGLKIIRKYHDTDGNPDKFRVITFEGCFHGRTLATISAAKKDKLMAGFEPEVDGFDQVSFGDIEAVKKAITPETGGILIEPIIGEGGIKVATPEFLKALRELADKHKLLLFFDEIQCGMGRTGKFFAHQLADVKPDIVASAKGIGSGFPLGACLATKEAAKGMTPGSHGSTYAGNPLAVRVGNAVMDIMLAEGFLENVVEVGNYLKNKLDELKNTYPKTIKEVRGEGLILGIQIEGENRSFVEKLREKNLLTVPAAENIVRILPPLILEESHVDEGIKIIKSLCEELS